jgi:hypothetical protein
LRAIRRHLGQPEFRDGERNFAQCGEGNGRFEPLRERSAKVQLVPLESSERAQSYGASHRPFFQIYLPK